MKKIIPFLCLITLLCSTAQAWLPERYHTYAEMEMEILGAQALFPEIVKVDTLGYAYNTQGQSRAIYAVKISDNVAIQEDEPALVFTGVHHAEEIIGAEITIYTMKQLVLGYSVNDTINNWVNTLELWFIPIVNPWGHQVVFDSLDFAFRKNMRDNNSNNYFDVEPGIGGDIDGIDLNRNYDFNWVNGESSWESDNYRGPTPFSEAETQAVKLLIEQQNPVFAINYHSSRSGNVAEMIIYPWRFGLDRSPDYNYIKRVAQNIAERIPKDDGSDHYDYSAGVSRRGYARDWMYGVEGAFAYTIEAGDSIVPPAEIVDDICQKNFVGIQFLFDRPFYSTITGIITDADTGEPMEAEVRILEAYDPELPARTSDPIFGRYRRILHHYYNPYTIEIYKDGYETIIVDSVNVSPDGLTVLNFQMVWQDPVGIEKINQIFPFAHLSNYPNPFNGDTEIRFTLRKHTKLSVNIYDISGKLINDLMDEISSPGVYSIPWNGTDATGQQVPSGIYLYTIESVNCKTTGKMLYLQ